MNNDIFDLILKFITIGSVLTGGIAIYIAVRNNSRQVGAQIFLAYSDRIRALRVALGDENYPPRALLEAMFLIFEFYAPFWAMPWRSKHIGIRHCRFRTARSLLESLGVMLSRMKTIEPSAVVSLFVAGSPTNIQFMVKNAREFISTGGWGFAQFNDGKLTRVMVQDCFSCHKAAEARDFVFTRYSP